MYRSSIIFLAFLVLLVGSCVNIKWRGFDRERCHWNPTGVVCAVGAYFCYVCVTASGSSLLASSTAAVVMEDTMACQKTSATLIK
jgi:hypothetical protein